MRLENRPSFAKPPTNKVTKSMVGLINKVLQRLVPDSVSLTEHNQVIYAAGLYCIQKMYPNKVMFCRKEKPRASQCTPGPVSLSPINF